MAARRVAVPLMAAALVGPQSWATYGVVVVVVGEAVAYDSITRAPMRERV